MVKDATQASEEDIFKFMQSLGFQQIGDAKFSNIEYIVADLHPRNVLKDNNGIIYVVDDVIFALNDL